MSIASPKRRLTFLLMAAVVMTYGFAAYSVSARAASSRPEAGVFAPSEDGSSPGRH